MKYEFSYDCQVADRLGTSDPYVKLWIDAGKTNDDPTSLHPY